MSKRIFTGILIGTVYGLGLYISPITWSILVFITAFLGSLELKKIFESKGYRYTLNLIIIFIIILYTFDLIAIIHTPLNWKELHIKLLFYQNIILLVQIKLILLYFLFIKPKASFKDIGANIFSIIYLGIFPSYLILFRAIPESILFVFFTLASVAISDIGAYFGGKFWGKTPFFNHISPSKTLEGALGGIISSVILLTVANTIIKLPIYHAIILGLLISLTAQFGDLVESFIKRECNLKDSGELFRSHGGVLDRVDSYVFSGMVAYYYYFLFIS